MANRALVIGAVIFALPFGWGLGLLVAYLIAGKNFGQLPAATVPLGLLASVAFALWSHPAPKLRFIVMLVGAAAFMLVGWLLG